MGDPTVPPQTQSIDVQLADIRGMLNTLNAQVGAHLQALTEKVADGASALNNHVHHPNPHSEQELWLRTLIDSKVLGVERGLEAHLRDADRNLLSLQEKQQITQTRTDQQDGSLRTLKWLVGAGVTLTAGLVSAIFAHLIQ